MELDHLPNERATRDLSTWRYAGLFSLFVTIPLWLLAVVWIWFRDGHLHDVGFTLLTWAVVTVALTLGIKWDRRRR